MLSLAAGTVAFTAPHASVHAPLAHAHSMAPMMNEAEVASKPPASITNDMDVVVVPTSMGRGVVSWYDSGVRLSPEMATPEAAPAATAAAPTEVAAPADTTVAAVNMYPPKQKTEKWNPSGIDFSLAPYVGSFAVPEYVKFAPAYLDGEMPGDVGFDPLCLVALAKPNPDILQACLSAEARKERMEAMSAEEQQKGLMWMREAELKHARLAMLAAAGWPLAELVNGSWLRFAGTNGRAPSLFNGALFDFPVGVVVFLALAGVVYSETKTTNLDKVEGLTPTGYTPGDYGFDPLGYSTGTGLATQLPELLQKNMGNKEELQLAELKNGRAAMMAITGFAVQEFLWGTPVVEQTPFFFGR